MQQKKKPAKRKYVKKSPKWKTVTAPIFHLPASVINQNTIKPEITLLQELCATFESMGEELMKRNKARADDIAILKGKLTMLKRYLQTNGAIKAVDDIINPIQ